jgi:hypothetical protein
MDWENSEYRAALLKLWATHILKRSSKVQPLVEHLLELGWITQSPRQSELMLNELGLARLPVLLDRVWPTWRETLDQLHNANLPLTAEGLGDLARTSRSLPPLPQRLHHKTYAALARAHSKCLTDKEPLPSDLTLTTDGVLRIRANQGLILGLGTHQLSGDEVMAAVGEVILPERAILDGIRVYGALPGAVMTVENLGPFIDMPKPLELLLIHQPGWNTSLSRQLMQALGPMPSPLHFGPMPVRFHFGDLDPEGLAIYQHLHREEQSTRLFLPAFWDEYVELFAHPLADAWPQKIVESFSEPLLQRLFAANSWLEQEPIILDERIARELARLVHGGE